MLDSLPPYRRAHARINDDALAAGFESLPAGAEPAWQED